VSEGCTTALRVARCEDLPTYRRKLSLKDRGRLPGFSEE
jgi:hypothetical protein